MRMLIDRETRDALHDDCRSTIEGCSDLKIENPRDREIVQVLWRRLKQVGPLLDQIGWAEASDLERFDVNLNVRRMRSFTRHHLAGWRDVLESSVTTEEDLRASHKRAVEFGWPELTEDEFAAELSALRESVDEVLDAVAMHRRLLDVFDLAAATPGAVEVSA